MSVYIHDPITSTGAAADAGAQASRVFHRGVKFSHLMADTEAELRAYARELGLSQAWLQHPGTPRAHFDVTGRFMERALRDPCVVRLTHEAFGALLVIRRAAAGQNSLFGKEWQ